MAAFLHSLLSTYGSRKAYVALAVLFVLVLVTGAPVSRADQVCLSKSGCFTQAKRDVVFLIDRSGSIALRGQTYNIEIEGLACALRDKTVIPRDGSFAIAVVLFNESSILSLASSDAANNGHLKGIDSDAEAEGMAAAVEQLKCSDINNPAAPFPCPFGNTGYGQAIKFAYSYINQNGRKDASRMIMMSTDGQPTDGDKGPKAATEARAHARELGIAFEINAILVGLDPHCPPDPPKPVNEFEESRQKVGQVVFSQNPKDLPGTILAVDSGSCDPPNAQSKALQVSEFIGHIRSLLLTDAPLLNLVVTTNADTSDGQKLSLRQAIELANCNGGNAAITFDESLADKVISPLTPLPALTAPGIRIEGIVKCGEKGCVPSVTINGAGVDVTGGEAHSDGILIRSYNDVVRSLRIINFKRSGVAVEPLCPSDNTACNRMEANKLENNAMAGVMILDAKPGQAKGVSHNTGNIISRNTISGSATLIDLGGDGPTPNDDEDKDEGPNKLLNFPVITSTVQTGEHVVTVKGKSAAGSVIELFMITGLKEVPGTRAIDAVEFVKEVTADSNGEFASADLPISPTGLYAATAIDPIVSECHCENACRNTSELTAICDAPPAAKITLESDGTTLEFKRTNARSAPRMSERRAQTFTVENTGCGLLTVSFESIARKAAAAISEDDRDDSKFFSVRIINADGTLSDFATVGPVSILPGSENARKFKVIFHPVIPPFTGPAKKQVFAASEVLPDVTRSVLNITHNGEGPKTIDLLAKVGTTAQLIDLARNPSTEKPVVILRKSGDVITVNFYIYDSDLSENEVNYEFFDRDRKKIALNQPHRILHPTGVVKGTSYEVMEDFSNANEHPEIATVRVTIFDNGKKISAESGSTGAQANSFTTRRSRKARSTVSGLPPIKLTQRASNRRAMEEQK